jgi:hypothetical protein
MIDIGTAQVCFLADPAAELEVDSKNIIAAAFYFKFMIVALERVRHDNLLATTMHAGQHRCIIGPDVCFFKIF